MLPLCCPCITPLKAASSPPPYCSHVFTMWAIYWIVKGRQSTFELHGNTTRASSFCVVTRLFPLEFRCSISFSSVYNSHSNNNAKAANATCWDLTRRGSSRYPFSGRFHCVIWWARRYPRTEADSLCSKRKSTKWPPVSTHLWMKSFVCLPFRHAICKYGHMTCFINWHAASCVLSIHVFHPDRFVDASVRFT